MYTQIIAAARELVKMQATISQFFSCFWGSTAGQNDCKIDWDSDDGNDYPGDHVYKGISDDEFDNDRSNQCWNSCH